MGRYRGEQPRRGPQPAPGAPQTDLRSDPTPTGFSESDGDGSGFLPGVQATGTEDESPNAMARAFRVVAYRATREAIALAEDVAERLRRSGNSAGASGALQVALELRERLPK